MGQAEFFARPQELKIQPLCYVIVRFLERRGSIRLNSPPDKKFLSDLPWPEAKFRDENPQQNLGTDWPKEQSEPSRSWADNPPKSSHRQSGLPPSSAQLPTPSQTGGHSLAK